MLYQLDKIQHDYNDQPVLTINRWRVSSNTIVGLLGPNGSGKSTLLRLLGFVEQPTRGTIHFNDRKAELYAGSLRSQVTLLPQQSYLLKRSVYQNIVYGLNIRKQKENVPTRVYEALEWVGLDPMRFAQRPWFALSGGEARRVALAARLVLRPQVFLLDEPTTSVDAASAHMMKQSIMRAREEWNTTLIISSHDTEWLNDISDQTMFLFHGQVMNSSQPTFIFGPWVTNGNGLVYKTVEKNERMIAPHPQKDLANSVAVIDADQLRLYDNAEDVPKNLSCVKGLMMRLSLEKGRRRVGATVAVGNLTLYISLQPEAPLKLAMAPGQTVWIGYDPHQIRWMD